VDASGVPRFRGKKAGFTALTGQMISFEAVNAQKSCIKAEKLASWFEACRNDFGG